MKAKHKSILGALAVLALLPAIVLYGCGGAPKGNGGVTAGNGQIEKAKAPAIGVAPSIKTVKVGEDFDIKIMIKAKDGVHAAGCQVTWSGTGKIECSKIEEGDFFSRVGKTNWMPPQFNPATGTTSQLAVALQGKTGASGEGTVFVLHFKAVAPGEVDIKISEVQVTDLYSNEIQITKYDGKVIVQ